MTIKQYRITRPWAFESKIREFLDNKGKWVYCKEIGGETAKEHFHIYIEVTGANAHNWSRIWKTFCDKNELKGNEDFSERKKYVRKEQYDYICKGDDEHQPPKVASNFLSETEVLQLQKEYWSKKRVYADAYSERTPEELTSMIEVLKDDDTEAMKRLKLQLQIEKEKTIRKSLNPPKVFKKDFHEYIIEQFEIFYEELGQTNGSTLLIKWTQRDIQSLEKWLVRYFIQEKKPRFCSFKPVREYRNYLIGTKDPEAAYELIKSDY